MQKPRIEDVKVAWLDVQRRGLNVVLCEVVPELTTGEGARRLQRRSHAVNYRLWSGCRGRSCSHQRDT